MPFCVFGPFFIQSLNFVSKTRPTHSHTHPRTHGHTPTHFSCHNQHYKFTCGLAGNWTSLDTGRRVRVCCIATDGDQGLSGGRWPPNPQKEKHSSQPLEANQYFYVSPQQPRTGDLLSPVESCHPRNSPGPLSVRSYVFFKGIFSDPEHPPPSIDHSMMISST